MERYKVNIPEGKSGDWEIKKFTVSEEDAKFDALRSIGRGGRYTPAGTYTSLTRNGQVIMSDTPDEIRDHLKFIRMAKGKVLINGLGLGMVLKAVLDKPDVEFVTVIEKSPHVISLVAPYFQVNYEDKVKIIWSDAFAYKSPKNTYYGAVWHDIWDNLNIDNLPEMTKLHRKYGRLTEWQDSWCKERLQSLKKQGRWR